MELQVKENDMLVRTNLIPVIFVKFHSNFNLTLAEH